MLRDVELLTRSPIGRIFSPSPPVRVAEGVYESGFNFNHELESNGYRINYYPFQNHEVTSPIMREIQGLVELNKHNEAAEARERLLSVFTGPADFGVCDDWEQVVERWPVILESPRHFVIGLCTLRREDQPTSGGWRWHKWGEYIGAYEPTTEYLRDEPVIEQVKTFHVIEVLS